MNRKIMNAVKKCKRIDSLSIDRAVVECIKKMGYFPYR